MTDLDKHLGKSAQPKSRPRSLSLFLSLLFIGFIIPILAGCDVANSLVGEGADSTAQTATQQPAVSAIQQPTIAPTQPASAAATQQPTAVPTQQQTITPTQQPTVAATQQPSAASTQQSSASSTQKWCDSFQGKTPDGNNWQPVSDASLIFQSGGALQLGATAAQSAADIDAWLEEANTDQPISELSFTIALISYQGTIPGGAGLEIFQQDGRDSSMYVGPGDSGPGIEFSICKTTKCDGTYDQYLHPGGGDFPVGKRVPIRVVSTGGKTQFYVDNALSVEYAGDPSPITDFQFSMYANKGAAFRVTVENLCVQYAGK